MNKKKTILTTLLLSVSIGLLILLIERIYPFGNNTMLLYDIKDQYITFYIMFRNILMSGKEIFYSFNLGFGTPLISVISYYLLNPLATILLLFNNENIIKIISIFTLLIIPLLCSFSMSYYLTNKNCKHVPMLSVLYAYSAYTMIYASNFMWTVELIALPLITLGIERVVKNKKSVLYFIALFIALLSNYYIGYMLCIYSVIYFSIYLFINRREVNVKESIINFIKYSLLSGLLCSFIFLPTVNYLFNNSEGIIENVFNVETHFNIFELVSTLFTGSKATLSQSDIVSTTPNIGTSIMILPLLIMFFVNKKINKKEKLLYASLFIIYFLFVYVKELDLINHGLHHPVGFPYRYSFIIIFILINIANISLNNIDKNDKSDNKKIYIIISSILLVLLLTLSMNKVITMLILVLNVVLIIFYLLLFKVKKDRNRLLLLVVIPELLINVIFRLPVYSNYQELTSSIKKNNEIISKIDDDSFYRIISFNETTRNDGAFYNYNSVNSFYSANNYRLIILNSTLGVNNNGVNSICYDSNNDLYNALFDVKYSIKDDSIITNDTIGLMYYVDKQLLDYKVSDNVIDNYNNIVTKMFNIDDIIVKANYKKKEEGNKVFYEFDDKNIFIVPSKDNYYLITNNYKYISSSAIFGISDENDNYYTYNGIPITDNKLEVVKVNDDYKELGFYKVDRDKLNKMINAAEKVDFTLENDSITLSTNNTEDRLLFTSIPDDMGLSVYIDGTKVEKKLLLDAFIGIEVPKGEHNIKIEYKLPLLREGSIITVIILLSMSAYYIYFNRHDDYK